VALAPVEHALTCIHFTVTFARKAAAEGKFKVDKKLLLPAVMQLEAHKRVSEFVCVSLYVRARGENQASVCMCACMHACVGSRKGEKLRIAR
jgi:hypothetical protein